MKKLILSGVIGAALMYLFDPQQGKDRRESLTARLTQDRAEAKHKAQRAMDTGKSVVEQAKSAASGAQERLDATLDTVKRRASGSADEAQGIHAIANKDEGATQHPA